MAPINNSKNPHMPKKQTGTVPKLSSVIMHSNSNSLLARDLALGYAFQQQQQQHQQTQPQQLPQKPLQASKTSTPSSNKTKPNAAYRSGTSRKNTEVVAPTRRELNDLNDYLLITSGNNSTDPVKQQNNQSHSSDPNHPHSTTTSISNSHADTSGHQQLDTSACYDIENINFQENQRFCYPVRPIPRRNSNKSKHQISAIQNSHINSSHSEQQNLNISNTSSTSSSTAVGVVIPTTPANSNTLASAAAAAAAAAASLLNEDNYNLLSGSVGSSGGNNISRLTSSTTYQNILCDQQQQQSQHHQPHSFGINGIPSIGSHLPIDLNNDLSWEERLNFIQYFLSVTSKLNNHKGPTTIMVNEMEDSKGDEIIVNSTSLEDVAQSESSDRAHSVSSIHTLSGAEPSTPNYEELQQRLENSNRNIQNIKDQQQQLLRLQQTAKQHLTDMEEVRTQMPIRFAGANGTTDNGIGPDYESVEQVHNDMSALVNRMKNLQTFIQNQNDLSALLGEDSPDLLAEQELLQKKLNDLKSHRVEMRNLVDELQNINTTAEKSMTQQQSQDSRQETNNSVLTNGCNEAQAPVPIAASRVVPVEYQRVVPIELVGAAKKPPQINLQQQNGHIDTDDDNDAENDQMDAETAEMIKQKVSDINAMKKQLQRLKDMMVTVKLIEGKADGPDVKDIGRSTKPEANGSRISAKGSIEVPASIEQSYAARVKKAYDSHENDETAAEEAAMSERVRLLHEMTDDLRNQAMSLTSERDRLKALREELKIRRDFEVDDKKKANNQLNESESNAVDADKSEQKCNNIEKPVKNALEIEYEQKKKEFERLCEQLQTEEDQNDETATVTGNEDNEDLDDEVADQAAKQENSYFSPNWQRNATSISCNSSINQEKNCSVTTAAVPTSAMSNNVNRGKDSADSGAADIHGNGVAASLEAGSMQSGSSRSFSMPPPMRSINNPSWRKNSHEHGHAQPGGCEHYMTWNAYPMYQNPYGYMHMTGCGPPGAPAEYGCSNHAWNNLGLNGAVAGSNTVPNTNDPVLLQQFIQTQQMLINSVCQCNQMLWHQQREINNLNNTVVMLQERIMNSTPDMQSLQGNRSESVPPLPPNGTMYGIGMNRAQSEQPLHASVTIPGPLYTQLQQQQQSLSTPISPNRQCSGFNYNTSQNLIQQQRRHIMQNHNSTMAASGGGGGATTQQSIASASSNHQSNYNYSTEHTSALYANQPVAAQQPAHVNSSANSVAGNTMAFNNSQPINFLNNDPAHQNNHSAGPIFMHHHNNNIGGIGQHQPQHSGNINNSNSNVLHQNVSTNSPTSTTATSAGALNNQVAPGTRANNYWDNFRSYSRQNLLSSNSCKSNEELNQQMQQQHHLHQQQIQQQLLHTQSHQQQQPHALHTPHQINNSTTASAAYNLSPIPTTTNMSAQNDCRPLSSDAVPVPSSSSSFGLNLTNTNNMNAITASVNSNNLNPSSNYDNKYFHTFRNEFNSNHQHVAPNSTNASSSVQPINLSINSHTSSMSALNCASVGNNIGATSQTMPAHSASAPFNSNINEIQHLEVNQGGSASSNLSVAQSDNLNENFFDFTTALNSNLSANNNINLNNNNNINISNQSSQNNAINAAASFFGSPDFRNMNFNFGLHESKKVPMKTACTSNTKRLRHTQSAPNNSIDANDAAAFGISGNINMSNSQSNHNFANNQNSDQHRYEEMGEGAIGFDETSEEIKRNLLVNALKSDKFTSKFFESLKEDVYRQAYAIIQEKKSDPQFLSQLFEEIKGAPAYDPLRNMLVQSFQNANRSAANQQHQRRTNNDTESNDGDNEMENEESLSVVQTELPHIVAAASSPAPNSGIQNVFKVEGDFSASHEINFQTPSKFNQSNNSNDNTYLRNSMPTLSNTDNWRDSDIKALFFNTKDLKFPPDNVQLGSNYIAQQKNKSNDIRNERRNQQYQARNFNEPRRSIDIFRKRPESHIISYTILKIRKEIQKQQIDDPTLLKIVKITIQTLEDAILNLQQPSPVLAASLRSLLYRIKLCTKEIYTKMKNFQNQEKDNFLNHYQSYLNSLLIDDANNINLAKPTKQCAEATDLNFWQGGDSNSQANKPNFALNNQMQWNQVNSMPKHEARYKSNITSACVSNEAKVMNSSDNQNIVNEIFLNLNQQNVHISHRHQQNQYQHQQEIGSPCTSSNNIMNADLAEADQICSAANNLPTNTVTSDGAVQNNGLNNIGSGVQNNCSGAVGYNNMQSSNDNIELLLNDSDVVTNGASDDADPEEISQYNEKDADEEDESAVLDFCDNHKVEDDQDIGETIAISEPNNPTQMRQSKSMVGIKSRQKRSKNHKKSEPILANNDKLREFDHFALTSSEDYASDSTLTNSKTKNVTKNAIHNSNVNTVVTTKPTNDTSDITCTSTVNNTITYAFPPSLQSDSMINNNLDMNYQSVPQPDSNSSLSNSNTESAESNRSSTEFVNSNSNSGKRNSVP